ncbi:solute carrier family 2, facilitated glucose transporter member 1-like [Scaptodrosophila lebanonensis]|uniref:Solute carrier family 2, facilitated glucose transporter member 1-like n=1 Tax=Drosophila lebanonensis TaxID=7225 RepID=A0A6J2SYH1_DROLE|nr:solute carrier family 2, facilitated glucose transporter member 1-like [Scaptodrosophila lebanonensis]
MASKTQNATQLDSLELAKAPLMAQSGKTHRPQWTKALTWASIGSTLGTAVPAGYCTGVVNSPAVHMRAWCNETLINRYDLHLTDSGMELIWSAIVSIFLVGGAAGSLTGASIANRFGRRSSFYICGMLMSGGAACFFFCRLLGSVELLILGRLLVGLAAGLTTTFLAMYHSEMAALEQRGALAPLCGMGLTVGVVLAQIFSLQTVFGGADRWHIALSFYAVFVIISFAPYRCYPDSPKWLYIVKGKQEEAKAQLEILRGYSADTEELKTELANMEEEATAKSSTSGFSEVLRNPRLRLPLVLVCAYPGGQQLSGINAIFYYSVSIFLKAGLSQRAAEWVNLGAGSVNLAGALFGPLLMARINRRPLMLFSSFFSMVFLFLFAMMLYYIESYRWFAMGCVACIFLYIFVFQLGLGPIPFFIGSELFEVAPRPVAMALGSVSSWSCNFIIGMTFPSLQNAWGALVFLPCSFVCLLIFCLTKRYLPETRGRDSSAVAPLMADGFKSKVH